MLTAERDSEWDASTPRSGSAALAALREAVEGLELSLTRAELAEAYAIRSALDARLTAAVGDYDAARLWDVDGASSMAALLRHDCGLSSRDAHRVTATGRFLRAVPSASDAWITGALSDGQIDVIVRAVGRHTDLFAQHAPELVPLLAPLDVTQTSAVLAAWRRHADALHERDQDSSSASKVHLSRHVDGQWALTGDLDPTLGALLDRALAHADRGDLDRSPAERRAEALGELARHYLDHHDAPAPRRHRPHVSLVLDGDDLGAHLGHARWDDGSPCPDADAAWLSCDCVVHRVIRVGSAVIDVGHATRSIPPATFHALVLRDGGCRWPGCDRPAHWCDAHHLVHWADGGATRLDNLVLLCGHHHRVLHRAGWKASLHADGSLDVISPHGHLRTTHPPHHHRRTAQRPFEPPPPDR